MAKHIAGTWDGAPNFRWKKMVNGVTWVLLCRGQKPGEQKENTGWLGLDEKFWSKVGSAAAANEWWKKRLLNATKVTDSDGLEYDLAAGVRSDEMVAAQDELQAKVKKLSKALRRLGVPVPDQVIPGVRLVDDRGTEQHGTIPITQIQKVISTITPVHVNQCITPANDLVRQLWESLHHVKDQTLVDPETTLDFWKREFLKLKKSDGKRGSGSFDNLKRNVERFLNWFGEGAAVAQITEAKCLEFHSVITSSDFGDYAKRDALSGMSQFCKFLWKVRKIDEIRTLGDLKYSVPDRDIEHFTSDQLRTILKESKGTLRLFVFLFANCGMRQRDVATINWKMLTADGYLVRKRAKTKKHKSAPVVKYKLWPETRDLIQEHATKGSGSQLAFLQPNGKPWVLDDSLNANERRCRDDNFAGMWRAYMKDHPEWQWQATLKAKDIRGSAANLIDGSDKLSLQVRFLADVPSGVILRHYIVPTQNAFDQAVDGLRELLVGKAKRPAKTG